MGDWIMGEPVKVLITKRQSLLMGANTLVIAIWAGVSSTTPNLVPRLFPPQEGRAWERG
jgi:hypothetical protein